MALSRGSGMESVTTNNEVTQTLSWCRYAPMTCLRQVAIETAFLAVSYVAILFATNSVVPSLLAVVRFSLLFALLSFAGRQISDGLGDKISVTALTGLGAKVVSVLAPKFVTW